MEINQYQLIQIYDKLLCNTVFNIKTKKFKRSEFQLLKKLRRVNHKMQVVFIAVAELLLRYEDGKMV